MPSIIFATPVVFHNMADKHRTARHAQFLIRIRRGIGIVVGICPVIGILSVWGIAKSLMKLLAGSLDRSFNRSVDRKCINTTPASVVEIRVNIFVNAVIFRGSHMDLFIDAGQDIIIIKPALIQTLIMDIHHLPREGNSRIIRSEIRSLAHQFIIPLIFMLI